MNQTHESLDRPCSQLSDAELWAKVSEKSLAAFEELVRRHQTVVAAVAYSVCGDFTLSEDIAQEAFLTAWRTIDSVREPDKVRSWLCGIARNLAKNSNRRMSRRDVPASDLGSVAEPWQDQPTAIESAVSREEQTLVWQALEEIPEVYREVLVLFYREDQSVADVAAALDISADTVRQRLSRGREFLRKQVTIAVEGALTRSRPTAAFTLSVMAGVTVLSAGTKAIAAASVGVGATSASAVAKSVSATLATGSAAGVAGGLIGAAGGLAGGWLGSWLPAQLAPTNRERQLILKIGRRILIIGSVAVLVLLGTHLSLTMISASPGTSVMVTILWILSFQLYVAVEVARQTKAIRKIRRETTAEQDPNSSRYLTAARNVASKFVGRVYCSPLVVLGRPLVHFNVSTPQPGNQSSATPCIARGWIAIGDQADGILLAIGGRARGFIAIGGIAVGFISIGGLAIGAISLGGLSLGVLSIGGLGLGAIAFGGLAVGWQACGGGALGWDFACGGAAAAMESAIGGAAWADKVAVGGYAVADSVNDPAAQQLLEAHWMFRAMKWQIDHNALFITLVIVGSLLPALLMMPLFYRKRRESDDMSPATTS